MPPGARPTSAAELYQRFLEERNTPPSTRMVAGVRDPLRLTSPFPAIFSGQFTQDGYIDPLSNITAAGEHNISHGILILMYRYIMILE